MIERLQEQIIPRKTPIEKKERKSTVYITVYIRTEEGEDHRFSNRRPPATSGQKLSKKFPHDIGENELIKNGLM